MPAGGADGGLGPTTGSFPSIDDPAQPGPYAPATRSGANRSTVFYPAELDGAGRAHPVVIWDNAAGLSGATGYQGLLLHLASHGFVVVAAEYATVDGSEILAALDWIRSEQTRAESPYFGKLDLDRVAAAGHGLGSIATFAVASAPGLSTTVHLSGATSQYVGGGQTSSADLRHPALLLCDSGGGKVASFDAQSSCQSDFDDAEVPVFFATVSGSEQLNLPANVAGVLVSWLRWRLMDDASFRPAFVGPSCTLCSRTNWSVQQRDLETLP